MLRSPSITLTPTPPTQGPYTNAYQDPPVVIRRARHQRDGHLLHRHPRLRPQSLGYLFQPAGRVPVGTARLRPGMGVPLMSAKLAIGVWLALIVSLAPAAAGYTIRENYNGDGYVVRD